jgi:hypothetical protein
MSKYSDLMRSYAQYKKHQEIGHLELNPIKKVVLAGGFFLLPFSSLFGLYYKFINKSTKQYRIHILSFGNQEPMGTILEELTRLEDSRIICPPVSLPVFPFVMWMDFCRVLFQKPLWVIRNLDFFGALGLKVSQYYGYKCKYKINKLLFFQEYSFYSSYLTYLFERDKGALYNLMHGIPGKESCCFRFTKCFVWGEYFKQYYIENSAEKTQFIIAGSIYHRKLSRQSNKNNYDIIYALQGDMYVDIKITHRMLKVLSEIQKTLGLKIGVKKHPIYISSAVIPNELITIMNQENGKINAKMVVSHFSTMLLDAKVLGRKVLAYVPKEKRELVKYLGKDEVVFEDNNLYKEIVGIWFNHKSDILQEEIVDLKQDPILLIEKEI